MEITVKRRYFGKNYTIGKLSIDGEEFCDTLEDTVRDFGKAGEGKVYGKTAIPVGVYKVILTFSNRFKRVLPLICNVPHFEGIRIHPGNTAEDTHGCILVGKNSEIGKITESKATFERLFNILSSTKEEIVIRIY